jgi:hypothetical protein
MSKAKRPSAFAFKRISMKMRTMVDTNKAGSASHKKKEERRLKSEQKAEEKKEVKSEKREMKRRASERRLSKEARRGAKYDND